MATSYAEAVAILESVAAEHRSGSELLSEVIPLGQASGRITARGYVSPLATPTFDSSAMDGFAVVSDATTGASKEHSIVFKIQGCTAAGDPAVQTTSSPDHGGLPPCVEIMTGASFPIAKCHERPFDAVVKVEDVVRVDVKTKNGPVPCIEVSQPVARHAHKRFAGSDFDKEEPILRENQTIRPQHIMAMASVGFAAVQVRKRVRVGVWSTGCELASPVRSPCRESKIMDANAPFLEATLREFGAEVEFLGVIDDDEETFKEALQEQAHAKAYDVLITTGAVSKGKFDFVPSAVKYLGSTVRFHGVAIRPGHPVLFATLPPTMGNTAFFGLPGNPVATAVCTEFIVAPYLYALLGVQRDPTIRATVVKSEREIQTAGHAVKAKNGEQASKLDCFKHGRLSTNSDNGYMVEVSADQSPAKLRPLSVANCWCHIPPGRTSIEAVTTADCYSF